MLGGCRGCMLALVPHHAEFPAPLGAESRRELGSTWVSLQPDEDPGVSIAWGSLGAQCGVFCNAQRCQLPPRRRQSCRRWGGGERRGGKGGSPPRKAQEGLVFVTARSAWTLYSSLPTAELLPRPLLVG